jgi:hypothetical protein
MRLAADLIVLYQLVGQEYRAQSPYLPLPSGEVFFPASLFPPASPFPPASLPQKTAFFCIFLAVCHETVTLEC